MVNRTLYWVKIDHLDSVICIECLVVCFQQHTHTLTHIQTRTQHDSWQCKSRFSHIRECALVLCTHCQKQLNLFERSMRWRQSQVFAWLTNRFIRSIVCSIHFAKSHSQSSNPFIANYQIYRLPLKTIKILSSYLRFWFLIEHWAFHSCALQPANASAHTRPHTFPLLFELLFNFTALFYTSFRFLGKTIYVNRSKAKWQNYLRTIRFSFSDKWHLLSTVNYRKHFESNNLASRQANMHSY